MFPILARFREGDRIYSLYSLKPITSMESPQNQTCVCVYVYVRGSEWVFSVGECQELLQMSGIFRSKFS